MGKEIPITKSVDLSSFLIELEKIKTEIEKIILELEKMKNVQ